MPVNQRSRRSKYAYLSSNLCPARVHAKDSTGVTMMKIKCECPPDGHTLDCANRRLRKLAKRVACRERLQDKSLRLRVVQFLEKPLCGQE